MDHLYAHFLVRGQGSPPDVAALISILGILAIDVVLIFYCLGDLNRHEIVAGGDKRFWAMVIILGGPLGQIVYWLYGRGPY